MHFFFCLALLVRLILAIPVEDLFFSNEAVDPNDVGYSLAAFDPPLASEDIFAAHTDSSSKIDFPDTFLAETPPYSLAADIDLCVFGENDGQPTSKVRVRDSSCPPASNANPQLSLPTLDQLPLASDSSAVDDYGDLKRLFNVETWENVKEDDPDNLCPAAKTFGSKIPVCFTGERFWDREKAFGQAYCTLYKIRPCLYRLLFFLQFFVGSKTAIRGSLRLTLVRRHPFNALYYWGF